MKNLIYLLVFLLSFTSCSSQELKDGDIIFHTSKSSQSQMLQIATNSNITHVGVIFFKSGKPYVFEAVNPVKITPLQEFINRGVGHRYSVKRTKTPIASSELKIMMEYGKRQLGKPYDSKFQWSDSKIYCSELVWKIYHYAGIRLCDIKEFSDYNLDRPIVKQAIKLRYQGKFNVNESVVAPVDLYKSDKLKTFYSNL
jgi:uncharacterized protein YycO